MGKKILYIGGFELPDKNAAAQRVVGIAKALRDLGHEVYFLNYSISECASTILKKKYFGFKCYEINKARDLKYRTEIVIEKVAINNIRPDVVIAYNYPSISLEKLRKFCNSRNIKVIGDVTEWDLAEGNLIYSLAKNIDTKYRMEVIHPKLDGLICISRYLYDYYKDKTESILVPPLVDITDEKWDVKFSQEKNSNTTYFVYAGSPSAKKERLNDVVKAINEASKKRKIKMHVVGVTRDQFITMYSWSDSLPDNIKFLGRVSHEEAIKEVKFADWSIILRDDNRKVKAGFPTKLVESITCGTPVIANEFSNISDYLNKDNAMILEKGQHLTEIFISATNQKRNFNKSIFDYRNYIKTIESFFTY